MADQIPAHAIAGLTTPGSGAVDARAVAYAGTLDSTDVAAALDELDADKAAVLHTHDSAAQTVREALTAAAGDQILTLGASPVAGSPYVWVNGALLWPGAGYSIIDSEITLDAPLTAGDTVWVSYDTADTAPAASSLAPSNLTTPNTVAGLTQWLAADDLALADTAPVTAWADSSGNGYDYAAVSAPTFRTGQVNGKPCVDFDGTSNYLTFAGFPDDVFTRWTAFVVWRPDNASNPDCLWCQDRSGYNDDFLFGMDPANVNTPDSKVSLQIQQAAGSSLRTVSEVTAVTTGAWRINDFRYDGTNLDLFLNGTLQTSLAVANLQVDANVQWSLGRNSGAGGWNFDGGLAEIAFYNVALSDADRDAVRSGLGSKYGITVA